MSFKDKVGIYKELEHRGILGDLPKEKQELWAEIKRRGLDNEDDYNTLDKTKYMGRAAAEGMTLGLGDIVAGITNIPANYAAGNFQSPVKLFKEGRKDFVNEQNAFAEEHPYLNTAGELAGGLFTGIGGAGKIAAIKGINKFGKLGQSVATGALGGASYGAGSGLTEDAESLSPFGAFRGAATGAGLGAAFGAGAYGVGKAANKAKNFFFNRGGRAFNKLNEASGGALEHSAKKEIPFVDMANKKSLRVISGANLIDDEASELLNNYGNKRMQQHKINTENLIDKTFGNKGYESTLKELEDYYKPLYNKVYKNAMNKGIIKVNWDDDLRRFLAEVRSNKDISSAIKKYPDSHMRVLDQVKQAIDARIKRLTDYEGGLGVANLQSVKERLLKQMDKQNQYYKIARQIFERTKTFERGAEKGTKIFENPFSDIVHNNQAMGRSGIKPDFDAMRKSAEKLKGYGVAERRLADIDMQELAYTSMAKAERAGYKAGAAKKMRTLAESSTAEYENVAQKLFGLNRLRKLEAAGVDTSHIKQAAKDEIKAAQNMRNLFRGSQTAERGEDIGNAIMGPLSFAKKYAAAKINQLTGIKPIDIARIATDPGYAALMRLKAQAATGEVPFLNIGGKASAPFSGIVGNLTSKEKASYRNYVKNDLMTNARGKNFNGINFNKTGLGKGVATSANIEKLKLLEKSPKLAGIAESLPDQLQPAHKNIRYLSTPVSIGGKKDIAFITTERRPGNPEFFHNINTFEDFVKGYKKSSPQSVSGQTRAMRTINNIPKNNAKNKPQFNMKDFLILLQRPLNLGYNSQLILNNLKKREDK